MLRAAFCLPAVPAERNRGKEQAQIGYKLSGMFVESPFLNKAWRESWAVLLAKE